MARIIDISKMERVKETAIQMVVEKGYGGASIATIAKKAGVAEGYLYRFYKGKEELVVDLLCNKVNEIADELELLLQRCNRVADVVSLLVKKIFQIAENNPDHIKFLYVLMHDYNFKIGDRERERIFKLCREIKNIGSNSGEIGEFITEEDIYMLVNIFPIQFINLRIKNFFGNKSWDNTDKEHIIEIIIKTLKA
ncbi:MAG: TetR/AcrR family transcriptional regulator [Bacteroidota bacterium]|nr:TetR/AcrR family transcriptional regulator [Bacteroidota bacterium]MDP4204797.1 TetR/AcrR family transcriptional regulator [Bacteroidota bacterium]